MKTRITILLLFLFFVIVKSQAQIHVGFKAGLNYVNNVSVHPQVELGIESKYRLGYHAGVFAEVGINDKFSLAPELLISDKGFKYPDDLSGKGGKIHLTYINMPILLGYKIIDKLTVEAGPELGAKLSAKAKMVPETNDVSSVWDNALDFGMAAGVKYRIFGKWLIGARYIHGLTSVMKKAAFFDGNENYTGEKLFKRQNRTFQISCAYMLN